MKKRVLVVGGVAGGMTTAARVRRLDEDADVIVLRRANTFLFLIVVCRIIWGMRSLRRYARSHDAGSLAGAAKHRCSRTP